MTKARDFHRLSRQLNFKRCEIVTPESCVIELQKTNVVLSKPRYVGVAVLGISKYLMGDFHYNYIMKNFDPKQKGRNVKLLMRGAGAGAGVADIKDGSEGKSNSLLLFASAALL